MDDLGLDDMVSQVNKTGDKAKKDKNAQVQMMKKIRENHSSVTKVVIRDDPVSKTAEDIFKALAKNSHIESINLNKVKITPKAVTYLAKALKVNTHLETLILNNTKVPSEQFLDVIKALENDNTTLKCLHVFQGPNKYFDSNIEKAMKDRLISNTTIGKVNIAPIRSTDVRNALQQMSKDNADRAQKKHAGDDDWDNYQFDYEENDDYVYEYDPDWEKASELPQEVGSLKGNF